MLESLFAYMPAANRQGLDEFVKAHPDAVFVIEPFAPGAEASSKFQTVSGNVSAGTTISLARIRKREGANAFGMMITLGRAANNDIVIKAPDVSKFHAYLMEQEGRWMLADAGSSFGTFAAGRRLAREERQPLSDGDAIQLGSVKLTFHDPGGFYRYLRCSPSR